MATNLPVDIDAANADDATRPTVKTHQQHHDIIHAELNRITSEPTPVSYGFVVYVDNGAGGYVLASGQDDSAGTTPRWYSGPTDPTTIAGHVARPGDVWLDTVSA